jgi:hypothetical protein
MEPEYDQVWPKLVRSYLLINKVNITLAVDGYYNSYLDDNVYFKMLIMTHGISVRKKQLCQCFYNTTKGN